MNRKKSRLPAVILSLSMYIFTGCSHTNELAKYNLTGLSYTSGTHVGPNVIKADVATEPLSDDSNILVSLIYNLITAIGKEIATSQIRTKLANAIRPQGVVSAINDGFESDLAEYLQIHPVVSDSEKASLHVITSLKKLEMISASSGVYLKVKAESKIMEIKSSETIWENEVETEVPIREVDSINTDGSKSNAYSVSELVHLPEAEIQDAVLQAAYDAGLLLGDALNEDLKKIKK